MGAEAPAPVMDAAGPGALAAAAKLLGRGEVVAVPTDTVYGLAAPAGDPDAVRQLFRLKRRPFDRSVAVLVADSAAAERLVALTAPARRLAAAFWPGALTLVATRTPQAPAHLGDSAAIGVRVPDDDVVLCLAAAGPLAVTSANVHGQPTPAAAQELARLFPELSLVIDGGRRSGLASTVVDATGPVPAVLRQGPVTAAEVAAVAGGSALGTQ